MKPPARILRIRTDSLRRPRASQGDYEDVAARLESTSSVIEELRRVGGNAGITAGNNLWSQKAAKVLVDKSETAKLVGFLQPLAPFRSSFMYSNWGYGLLDEIMESVSGEDLESLFQRTLFKPLGLKRSSLRAIAGEWENVTKCYQALSDATTYEIPPTPYSTGSARAAAGAVKSTVNDLLQLYGAWMAAANDQASTGQDETPGSPFAHVSAQWTPHNKVTEESDYGLGWVLTNLPAKVSITSLNPFEGADVPVLAKGTAPRRLVYHHGSVLGGLSSVYLLPDTETAIVVLGNTFDLFDTADFVSQVLLEALLDAPEPNEYVERGRRIAASTLSQLPATAAKLEAEQVHGTSPSLPLEAYAGKYYNLAGNFFLDVSVLPGGGGLKMTPMSVEASAYDLRHYHHDVFFWPGADRDLQLKEVLFPNPFPDFTRSSSGSSTRPASCPPTGRSTGRSPTERPLQEITRGAFTTVRTAFLVSALNPRFYISHDQKPPG